MDLIPRLIGFPIDYNGAYGPVDQVELCSLKGSLALNGISVWSGLVSTELRTCLVCQGTEFLSKLEVLLPDLEASSLRNVCMRIRL